MIKCLDGPTRKHPGVESYWERRSRVEQERIRLIASIDKMPTRRVTWVDLDGTKGSGTGRVLPNGTTVVGTREQVLAYLQN